MIKFLLPLLALGFIGSCKEATIFGSFTNSEHGDVITVDCNYYVTLPTYSRNALPTKHDNELSLNINKINGKEITLAVEADSILWSFAIWNKSNETIEMAGRVYEKNETLNCK